MMIDVLNAGSGATSASRDKFPLDEARALGVPVDLAETVGRLWEAAARDEGADADFTTVIKPFEVAAGVTVRRSPASAATATRPAARMVLSLSKNEAYRRTSNTRYKQGR